MDDRTKLIYRVVKSYYEGGLTQLEIGNKFGLSRIKVSRLIKEAISLGLVKINIYKPKCAEIVNLAEQIEQKYSIDEVIITESQHSDEATIKYIGYEAAAYLDRILVGNEIIGLAWGNTIRSLVDALSKKNFSKMKIVQLMGGLGSTEMDINGSNLTVRAAHMLGAKEYLLASPGVLPTRDLRDVLMNEPQVSETLDLAYSADLAIVGLGSPTMTLPAVSAGIISKDDLDAVLTRGAVGDICLHFINLKGNLITSPIEDRVIAIPLQNLKKIPKVIGLAGGIQKLEVAKAALIGGHINVLITDSTLGEKLLL